MKLIALPKEVNMPLRHLLSLEYTREEVWNFYSMVGERVMLDLNTVSSSIGDRVIDCINSVLLDHVITCVKCGSINVLLADIVQGTLPYGLGVSDKHIELLSEDLYKVAGNSDSVYGIKGAVINYVDSILKRNQEEFYLAIQTLLECLYGNFNHQREYIVGSTFLYGRTPAILVKNENSQCDGLLS